MQTGSSGAAGAVGCHDARGFTFVWVLAALAIVSFGLAQAGPLWADAARRGREAELLRVGTLYAQALDQYRKSSPGTIKRYPETLSALLRDERFLGTQRWLRKLYSDPMQPGQSWGLLRDDEGRITGVYSTSAEEPFRKGEIDLGVTRLADARRYSDWRFTPDTASMDDKGRPAGNTAVQNP